MPDNALDAAQLILSNAARELRQLRAEGETAALVAEAAWIVDDAMRDLIAPQLEQAGQGR